MCGGERGGDRKGGRGRKYVNPPQHLNVAYVVNCITMPTVSPKRKLQFCPSELASGV